MTVQRAILSESVVEAAMELRGCFYGSRTHSVVPQLRPIGRRNDLASRIWWTYAGIADAANDKCNRLIKAVNALVAYDLDEPVRQRDCRP